MKMTIGVEAEVELEEQKGTLLERVQGVVVGYDPDGDLHLLSSVHELPPHFQVQIGLRLLALGASILEGKGVLH